MRLLLFSLALVLAACGGESTDTTTTDVSPGDATPDVTASERDVASAEINPVDGSGVSGTVEMRAENGATSIRLNLTGLTPGEHGFHVHEGDGCGPDSTGTPAGGAGGHFNPLASPHGSPSAAATERHAGDLGNVTANADGVVSTTLVDSVLTLTGPTSAIGHAVIVHGGRDDLESQPSGDAGDRVGCGVVLEGARPAAMDGTDMESGA